MTLAQLETLPIYDGPATVKGEPAFRAAEAGELGSFYDRAGRLWSIVRLDGRWTRTRR